MCDWFAKCNNTPSVFVDHPVLGLVEVCNGCRLKLDLTPERCKVCGEVMNPRQEIAEAYDPKTYDESKPDAYEACTHGLVHGECMLQAAWEMS